MPAKNPIFFTDAVRFAKEKARVAFWDGKIGKEPGENLWYQYNFIQFISESGFHIELTGDEFDFPAALATNH